METKWDSKWQAGLKFQTQSCLAPSAELLTPVSKVWKWELGRWQGKSKSEKDILERFPTYQIRITVIARVLSFILQMRWSITSLPKSAAPGMVLLIISACSGLGAGIQTPIQPVWLVTTRNASLSHQQPWWNSQCSAVPGPQHIGLGALPSPGCSLTHVDKRGSQAVSHGSQWERGREGAEGTPSPFKVTTWKLDALFLLRVRGTTACSRVPTHLQRRLGNVLWVATCPTKTSSRNGIWLSVSTTVLGVMEYISKVQINEDRGDTGLKIYILHQMNNPELEISPTLPCLRWVPKNWGGF